MSGGLSEVEGTRHHFTKGGRLVASKQIVYTIDQDIGLEPVKLKKKNLKISSYYPKNFQTFCIRLCIFWLSPTAIFELLVLTKDTNNKVST